MRMLLCNLLILLIQRQSVCGVTVWQEIFYCALLPLNLIFRQRLFGQVLFIPMLIEKSTASMTIATGRRHSVQIPRTEDSSLCSNTEVQVRQAHSGDRLSRQIILMTSKEQFKSIMRWMIRLLISATVVT